MESDRPFRGEPADTRERIMRATYLALSRHGYTGTSTQRIADEAGLSKSAFYNHYENKDDLLVAFLDFMLERYRTDFDRAISGDPVRDLNTLLTHAITGTFDPDGSESVQPAASSIGPLVELRAQAVNDETFRQRFTHLDEIVATGIASIIQSGIEQGVFRKVNPDRAAEVLLTLVMGSILRRATVRELDTDLLHTEVNRVLRVYLITDGSEAE